jgi:hypothetical protein
LRLLNGLKIYFFFFYSALVSVNESFYSYNDASSMSKETKHVYFKNITLESIKGSLNPQGEIWNPLERERKTLY